MSLMAEKPAKNALKALACDCRSCGDFSVRPHHNTGWQNIDYIRFDLPSAGLGLDRSLLLGRRERCGLCPSYLTGIQ